MNTRAKKLLSLSIVFFIIYLFVPKVEGQASILKEINWMSFPDTGFVSETDMRTYGQFNFAPRGFGNGPESNHNSAFDLKLEDDPFGPGSGRWAKVISRSWPGPNTVHTFGKSVRAVNDGALTNISTDEMWVDIPLRITDDWITHDQGKLGYSWTNPNGTSPGTNPTSSFEYLFHYFSPNNFKTNKPEAPWYSINPDGPFIEQDMLIGLDAYCADTRINTNFSEPIFFRENLTDSVRKVFTKDVTYILRAHVRLNTPGIHDGVLETWYSEDDGLNWTKSIEVLDFNWRDTSTLKFSDEGFVAFRGGSGHGFEVGGNGAISKNTGIFNAPQDTWYYLGNVVVYDSDPFDVVLAVAVVYLEASIVDQSITLNWSMTDIGDLDKQWLQKSDDGIHWQSIDVDMKSIFEPHVNYFFALDNDPLRGQNFYRVKFKDEDGTIHFSRVVSVYYESAINPIRVFPNPTQAVVLIEGASKKFKRFEIIGMSGIVEKTGLLEGEPSKINIQDLGKGFYFLKIHGSNVSQFFPILIE